MKFIVLLFLAIITASCGTVSTAIEKRDDREAIGDVLRNYRMSINQADIEEIRKRLENRSHPLFGHAHQRGAARILRREIPHNPTNTGFQPPQAS